MSKFFAYRIFMNEDPQTDLFDTRKKEEKFKSVFIDLKDNHKAQFFHFGRKYMYYVNNLNEDIHIWHLAKRQEFVKPVEGKEHIEQVKDEKTPFIYLIFNVSRQLVLLENNTTVFQDIETVNNTLTTYLNISLEKFRIECKLNPITDTREVWSKISEFEVVEKIEFDYSPPNFFGTHKDADKLVSDVHEVTGFEKFKILLQNKRNGLIFHKKVFQDHISRLASGAGEYVIQGLIDGVSRTISSINDIFKKPIENIDEKDEKYWEDLFNDIANMNNHEIEKEEEGDDE